MFQLLKKLVNLCSPRGLLDPVRGSEEDGIDLRNAHRNSTTPSESSTTADAGSSNLLRQTYRDLVLTTLRPSFPPECNWLEPSDVEVTGERPVDGGRFAEVWRGRLEDRKVAVKSYRYYQRFDQRDSVCTVGYRTYRYLLLGYG